MRAFIFPGQGSQAVGMGAALGGASRPARDVFESVDEALGQNLFRLMRDGPEDELKLTENAQPAIMAHALAVFAALTAMAGVSLDKAAQFVRRAQPWRIFGIVRGLGVRTSPPPQLFEVARAGDAGAVPVGVGAMAALLGADVELSGASRQRRRRARFCTVANDNDPSQV